MAEASSEAKSPPPHPQHRYTQVHRTGPSVGFPRERFDWAERGK